MNAVRKNEVGKNLTPGKQEICAGKGRQDSGEVGNRKKLPAIGMIRRKQDFKNILLSGFGKIPPFRRKWKENGKDAVGRFFWDKSF